MEWCAFGPLATPWRESAQLLLTSARKQAMTEQCQEELEAEAAALQNMLSRMRSATRPWQADLILLALSPLRRCVFRH